MSYLKSLNISQTNMGASAGEAHWLGGGKSLMSCNPATGQAIATVNQSTKEDYEFVLKKAQRSLLSWREVPAPKRGDLIRQIADELRKQKDALGSLVSQEMGKIKQEGDGEVQEMIDMADFAVGQARMLYGKTMHSERPRHRMYEQWHPLGVVGVISAFNFPVAVWAWNAFIAAICGDVVIWKPSPKTPLCALAIQHVCNRVMKANGYEGVFNLVISEDIEFAKQFVSDERLALISFTGSSHVGRQVNESVAKRFGRSILELSGNNALIVDETADFKLAISAIVFGAVGTAGQRCTTTRRLIVHEDRVDELIAQLKKAYAQISIGDPLEKNTLMGPLIDDSAVADFKVAVKEAKESGGEIICGGNPIDRAGFFVEPTIIRASNQWPVVQRETFAPILYVMTFKDFDEAIFLQNDVPQGLSSALFSLNVKNTEKFLSCLGSDCGIANINIGTSGAEIGGAFGGEKETGGGREAGSDAWKAYMRRQTNTINWSDELPLAQGIEFDF